MEKQIIGEFLISMYVTLPNSDRISLDKLRFKNIRIGSYHGVTEEWARGIKEEFIDANKDLTEMGSFVYEFKPYPTTI